MTNKEKAIERAAVIAFEMDIPVLKRKKLRLDIEKIIESLKGYDWIEAKKQLPKKPEEYIVSDKNGLVSTLSWEDNIWKSDVFPMHKIDQSVITHWMPLPTPPETNYKVNEDRILKKLGKGLSISKTDIIIIKK